MERVLSNLLCIETNFQGEHGKMYLHKIAEQIEWEPLALSLLNLLDNCEIDSEEVAYPIVADVFNSVEMALSVILSWQILLMMNDNL